MEHILDKVTLGALVLVRDKMMAQQASGRKVYRLEVGDTSFNTPANIRQAINDAMEQGKTHYPPSTGLPQLRAAMLKKMRDENHLPIKDAEHVMVTIGGMHGLYMAFCALLDPGDEVILPDPMWSEIAELIKRPGGVPVPITLKPDRAFLYDPIEIEKAITPRTKAIYLNTPHNPIGVVLSEETLKQIADIAIRHNLAVVSDEAYEHVIFDGKKHLSIGSLPGMADRTITSFTFSKTYAMTGLRLGYMASNDELLNDRFRKLLRLTTNGVPSITQWGGVAALTGPQDAVHEMAKELEARRNIFFEGIQSIKAFDSFRPEGAFYVWSKISDKWAGYQGKRDSWAMTNYLIDQAGIGTSPGIAFGPSGEGYVRFAFTVDRATLIESIEVMQDLFNK
ncbi:MAG TPA: pyridoxal phosphate-dependent aminotransferase [Anaerolineae bacterium]|nr:pyridoxal phosphate-dependent aminotransferase [Anaerolineae bacterium]